MSIAYYICLYFESQFLITLKFFPVFLYIILVNFENKSKFENNYFPYKSDNRKFFRLVIPSLNNNTYFFQKHTIITIIVLIIEEKLRSSGSRTNFLQHIEKEKK